jgi:hypothetical protein
MNITRDDIIDMCGCDAAEVDAIAEHENLPDVIAAALAEYLLHSAKGENTIKAMIREDIRAAIRRGDRARASLLIGVFNHFAAGHAYDHRPE